MRMDDPKYHQIVVALYEGIGFARIAKAFGLSTKAVKEIGKYYGITRQRRPYRNPTVPLPMNKEILEKQGGKCGLCKFPLGYWIGLSFVAGPGRPNEALLAVCDECNEICSLVRWNPLIIKNLAEYAEAGTVREETPLSWGGSYKASVDSQPLEVFFLKAEGLPFVVLPGDKRLYIKNREKILTGGGLPCILPLEADHVE